MKPPIIETVRAALRKKEIRLAGGLNEEDAEALHELEEIIEATNEQVNRVIVSSLARGYYRYCRDHSIEFDPEEITASCQEVQGLIDLFERYGVSIDEQLLRRVFAYQGLNYWVDFFQSEEFAPYYELPHVLRLIVINQTLDPKSYIRKVEAEVRQIVSEDRFESFRGALNAVRFMVVKHSSFARNYLPKTERRTQYLLQKDEYVTFRDTPDVVRNAAAYGVKKANMILRELLNAQE
ncbi:hypothetical protein ACFL2V_04230 [Pseudomonadota bacterium]